MVFFLGKCFQMIFVTISAEPDPCFLKLGPFQDFPFFFSLSSPAPRQSFPQFPSLLLNEHLSRTRQSVGVPTSLWQPRSRNLCSSACPVVHRCIVAIPWLRLHLLFQATAISLPPTAADVPSDQHHKRGDNATFIF